VGVVVRFLDGIQRSPAARDPGAPDPQENDQEQAGEPAHRDRRGAQVYADLQDGQGTGCPAYDKYRGGDSRDRQERQEEIAPGQPHSVVTSPAKR